MDPLGSSPKHAPERRPQIASFLGFLAGFVMSVAPSYVTVMYGWLNIALMSGNSSSFHCDASVLSLGIGLTLASVAVAGAAWYLLLRFRGAVGWWISFARSFTVAVAIFMLAPWPCGLTLPAGMLLSSCRPH